MPIPLPKLDDRDHAALVADLRARIPVHTPEWTDLGPADPGVTLLELVAFLGENVLYRFNQIPDATWARLLRLLDVPLRPPVAATGMVAMSATARLPVAPTVDAGTRVTAGAVAFETLDDVAVLPVAVSAAVKMPADPPADPDLLAAGEAALDGLGADAAAVPLYYRVAGLAADPQAPDAEPLDVAGAVDGALWCALIATDPTRLPDLLAAGSPLAGATLSLGVSTTEELPPMTQIPVSQGWSPLARATGQVSWSVSTTAVEQERPRYRALDLIADATGGLRRTGVVRLQLPADLAEIGVPEPPAFGAGAGDFPPVLPGAPAVVCWLRGVAVAGGSPTPPVRWLEVNATRVVQAVTAPAEYLGTGTGQPGQVYALAHRGVQADLLDVVVEVQESSGWVPWTLVDDLSIGGRDSRLWALDAEAGTATFGDTVRSRVPWAGERIRVRGYRYTDGAAGSVAAGAITGVESAVALRARNALPTDGGVDAESIGDALDRIPGELRRHDRAVTRSDFAELALATPGAEVIRAECLPRFHPASRNTEAAGVVTVIVWPRADAERPSAPLPSWDLLRRVCAYLDDRRLVTTELYVVPPEYRTVGVSVAMAVKPGYSPDALRRWAETVIRQYLAPVPPYGPDGAGWPLGRRVHAPELEAAVLQVEGIEYVTQLLVGELIEDSWVDGPVAPESWQVVRVGAVSVVAGEQAVPIGSLPTGDPIPPDPDGHPRIPVPVPTPQTECCS